jgi:hypothetical protein
VISVKGNEIMTIQHRQPWSKEPVRLDGYINGMQNSKSVSLSVITRDVCCRKTAERDMNDDDFSPENLLKCGRRRAFANVDPDANRLFCIIDGTSLKITDIPNRKGLGDVGTHESTKGLLVQTSCLVSSGNLPLGIMSQSYWARPIDCSESVMWKNSLLASDENLHSQGLSDCTTIIMDRGYDCAILLETFPHLHSRAMIRGAHKRLVCDLDITDPKQASKKALKIDDYFAKLPIFAEFVTKPIVQNEKPTEEDESRARPYPCRMQVKTAKVNVVHTKRREKGEKGGKFLYPVTVVFAQQIDPPKEAKPIRWFLLLNYDVNTPQEATQVFLDYGYRWKIEEFHKMWKSGGVYVEKTQLHTVDAIKRIGIMSSIAALNLLRICYVARENPDALANSCFSDEEIKGFELIDRGENKGKLLKKHSSDSLKFCLAVIAMLGGYQQRSNKPPGAIVLARGYQVAMAKISGIRVGILAEQENAEPHHNAVRSILQSLQIDPRLPNDCRKKVAEGILHLKSIPR